MRRFLTCIVMLLPMAISPVALCQGKPTDKSAASSVTVQLNANEQAAKDFKFEKISLGMELRTFRTLFPKADDFSGPTDKALGKVLLSLDHDSGQVKAADLVACMFFEDKLCEIRILYFEDALERLGGSVSDGADLLRAKMKEKFGISLDPFKAAGDEVVYVRRWNFKKVSIDLQLETHVAKDMMKIFVYDMAALERIRVKAKASADTGF